jgi:hypothetical protein
MKSRPWYKKSYKGREFDCDMFCVISAALGHRNIQRRRLINTALNNKIIKKLGHNRYMLNITGI